MLQGVSWRKWRIHSGAYHYSLPLPDHKGACTLRCQATPKPRHEQVNLTASEGSPPLIELTTASLAWRTVSLIIRPQFSAQPPFSPSCCTPWQCSHPSAFTYGGPCTDVILSHLFSRFLPSIQGPHQIVTSSLQRIKYTFT